MDIRDDAMQNQMVDIERNGDHIENDPSLDYISTVIC